jgi:hypothetical protein
MEFRLERLFRNTLYLAHGLACWTCVQMVKQLNAGQVSIFTASSFQNETDYY